MNTPTPTPRTDAAWSRSFNGEQMSAGQTARALRECSQKLETELTALTAERDQLKQHACADFEMFHEIRLKLTAAGGDPYRLHDEALDCLISERDQLRADCENETKWAAHYLAQSIADKARAERAEAELTDWSVLKGWGGTPAIVHKFIKGQQHRIHYCQNIEDELAAERARLDSGTILLIVAGERVWHCGVDLRAAIDAGMQEDAQ